eukprot:459395_1
MIKLLFPEVRIEYTPNFVQDKCARSSKVFFPNTCFKLHAPQTDQHDEGYLSVKTLEKKYTEKFYAVIHKYSEYNFDSFFDNNMAFYVRNLESYLEQIDNNYQILKSYIGLKWYHPSINNKTFYSLIIQSPHSQRIIELISFNKPNLELYTNIRNNFEWKETSVIRASFKQYPINEYPWTKFDYIDIVPIRISYATSHLEQQIKFYTEIMESEILQLENDVIDILDDISVSYAFLKPIGSLIEILYIQRPIEYTYGSFTTAIYSNLLLDTHNDVITDAYCGLDRYFDNHYGYDTSIFFAHKNFINYNYMDRVFFNIINNGYKYRLYWTSYIMYTEYEDINDRYDAMYKLFVFDRNGQSIQMIGYLFQTNILQQPPIYNHQWCSVPCPNNEKMGEFDKNKIYIDDDNDIVSKIISGQVIIEPMLSFTQVSMINYKMLISFTVIGIIICACVLVCMYKCYKCVIKTESNLDEETQLLLP